MISLSTNCRTVEMISVLYLGQPEGLAQPCHAVTLSKTAARPCPPPMHIVSPARSARRAGAVRAPVSPASSAGGPHRCPSEIPEPCTLVRSPVGIGELPLPHAGECLGGESLVEFDDVDVVQRQTGLIQCGLGKPGPDRCPSAWVRPRADAQDTRRTSGVSPSSAAFSGVVTNRPRRRRSGRCSCRRHGGIRILFDQNRFELSPATRRWYRRAGAVVSMSSPP